MKIDKMPIRKIIQLIAIGALLTALSISFISYLITGELLIVAICILSFIVLSIWGFILTNVIQKKLSFFTDEICQTIDNMMDGNAELKMNINKETLLSRIQHKLGQVYQNTQANRNKAAKQRAELQALISDVSHQVKTPTTNLQITCSTLLDKNLPQTVQKEFLHSMSAQIDKLDFLMGALIKSSRLETGIIVLKKKPTLIYETLAASLGNIFLQAEEKQLKITVNCPKYLKIPHDTKWTTEALFNILDNAVKYTSNGGNIHISVEHWESYTKIDISDTGKGIPEKHQAIIFQRFYREESVHDIDGIGIGLYLARKIISKQGGYIKVASEVNKGSTFSVFLPNN